MQESSLLQELLILFMVPEVRYDLTKPVASDLQSDGFVHFPTLA